MQRELLKGEEVIFQEGRLTVTNKRLWEGSQGTNSHFIRAASLKEVSEINLSYKRPIMTLISCILIALLVWVFSLALPDRAMLLLGLTSLKSTGFWMAAAIVFVGVMTFLSGATLVLEIKLKRGTHGASFRLALHGKKANRAKFLAGLQRIERAIIEEDRAELEIEPPALPHAV